MSYRDHSPMDLDPPERFRRLDELGAVREKLREVPLERALERHPFLSRIGWKLEFAGQLAGRPAELADPSGLPLHPAVHRYLRAAYPHGIYRHQHLALQAFAAGEDVCLATGTASGKSMVFYAAGIDALARDAGARIIAIYPLKALAREQEDRWRQALHMAGLDAPVGRIEGGVAPPERDRLLRRCRVILFTPDVIHAWLLSSLSSPRVKEFLRAVRLAVVDEVHVYTGVFGSNAAYLFRRLQHAAQAAGGGQRLRFLAASATIAQPEDHLRALFARPFRVVGPAYDTSPRHELDILMVRPPEGQDLNTAVPDLFRALAREPGARFIAFVDSRRQTEQLAAIVARGGAGDDEAALTSEAEADREVAPAGVLPYRAGYEEEDRAAIQEQLARGELAGVVSTSALELGLDIPGLNTVVLVGVPHSATSLRQRIGRVGRHGPGRVVVVDAGGVTDELVFRTPQALLERPLAQSALYLENRRIQYIHALCFAASGGEYDMLMGLSPEETAEAALETTVDWPEGFLDLCRQERLGSVPPDLQPLKTEAGDDPWHRFPLRDVDSQFQVELRQGGEVRRLGQLSFSQLMREAYPGAVYYYLARPYRVFRVSLPDKRVVVRRERYYTTEPTMIPPQVFPNLTEGDGFLAGRRFGDLSVVECSMYVSELVYGYTERRGSRKEAVRYPCDYWRRDRFTRNFVSTGVFLHHPGMQDPDLRLDSLAHLILEAFLLIAPFDRSEVAAAAGKHRQPQMGFAAGDRFIAVFDQTYGSLRLTGRLLEEETLRRVLDEALEIARTGRLDDVAPLNPPSLAALQEWAELARGESQPLSFARGPADEPTGERIPIIAPGSVGWVITESNQEFLVEGVFYHPKDGLRYRGRRVGENLPENLVVSFPVAVVNPIPGVSRMAQYDLETGEVIPLEP